MVTNNQNIGIVCPVPMGDWQASAMYEKLNIVKYNGTTYIAKKKNSNVQPETTSGWTEVWMGIADKGETGDIGLYHTMSPSSATVAISSLQPQGMTPIVGSAVLFPNGDVRQITGVNSSTITLGDVLFSVKGDPGIGNATLSNTDGDSTTDGFTQAAVKGVAQAKNYYNLGVFDTYVSNDDGTTTVTRKTGYFAITSDTDMQKVTNPAGLTYYIVKLPGLVDLTGHGARNLRPNRGLVHDCWSAKAYPPTGQIYYMHETTRIDLMADDGSKDKLFEKPIVVEYHLDEVHRYTEQVIENRPIRPANQDAEYYWHEEWRKGLNVYTGPVPFTVTSESEMWRHDIISVDVKPNTRYTLSYASQGTAQDLNYVVIDIPDTEQRIWEGRSKSISFVTPQNCTKIDIWWHASLSADHTLTNVETYSNIMLVEGSRPYPYKPYYGGIVREKDLSRIQLFPTDVNPAQTIGGDWEDKGTVTTSDNIVFHAYKRL